MYHEIRPNTVFVLTLYRVLFYTPKSRVTLTEKKCVAKDDLNRFLRMGVIRVKGKIKIINGLWLLDLEGIIR